MKKEKSGKFYRFCYAVFSKIIKCICRVKIINPENEPTDGGFLVCANHIGASDPIILGCSLQHNQARFMAKKELFKVPLLGFLIKSLGAFPVDRKKSDIAAIKKAVETVKDGMCVGIFPQGHRFPSVNPRTTPKKNGAALICARAKADVLPVYIWRKNNKPRLFRRTYVIIGNLIKFDELGFTPSGSADYTRLTDLVFSKICDLGDAFVPAK